MAFPQDRTHEQLTSRIIAACFSVYRELGYGFLESVYEAAIAVVLGQERIPFRRQAPLDVWFRTERIGHFRADLLIADTVILELKAARTLEKAHEAQLLNGLRATSIEVGLLFNFGPEPQLKRMAFSNTRKNFVSGLRSSAANSRPAPKQGR